MKTYWSKSNLVVFEPTNWVKIKQPPLLTWLKLVQT